MKQHFATNTTGKLLNGITGVLDILLDRYPGDSNDALGHVPADVLAAIADRVGLLAMVPVQVDAQAIAVLLGHDQLPGGVLDTLQGGRELVPALLQAYRRARGQQQLQAPGHIASPMLSRSRSRGPPGQRWLGLFHLSAPLTTIWLRTACLRSTATNW